MRWRRAGRLVALGLLGLGGLGALGLVFLTTTPGNDLLRRAGLSAFERTFPEAELSVDTLRTRLIDGVTLQGVRLTDAAGVPLVQGDRLTVDWNLRGVLHRRLVLNELRLDGPQIDLRSAPSGRLALLDALGLGQADDPTQPSQPWAGIPGELVVRSLVIREGEIVWPSGALSHLNLDLSGRLAGSTVELRGITAGAMLSGPVQGDLALTGGLSLQDGDLAIDALRARLDGSTVELSGTVRQVETTPDLSLAVDAPKLLAADVEKLLGAGAPAQDLAVTGRVEGELDALAALLTLHAGPGSRISVGVQADLEADLPAWSVDLLAAPLDLQALYPTQLTEPVAVGELQLRAVGSGLSWPGDLAAYVELSADESVLWGQEVPSLWAAASLADGTLMLHDVLLTHASGQVHAEGQVALLDEAVDLDLDLELPRLVELSDLAGTPLVGKARWSSSLHASWSDGVVVDASGPLTLREVLIADTVMPQGSGPLRFHYGPEGLDLSGRLTAAGMSSRGVAVDRSDVSWRVLALGEGATEVVADVELAAVSVDGSAATLAGATGRIELSLPEGRDMVLTAQLDVQGLRPTGGVDDPLVSQGPVSMRMVGDLLDAEVHLSRSDGSALLGGSVHGDLAEGGGWTVADLVLEPLPGLRWVGEGDQRFRLDDDGIADLRARLVGEHGTLTVDKEVQTGELSLTGQHLDLAQLLRLRALLPPTPADPAEPAAEVLLVEGIGTVELRLSSGSDPTVTGQASVAALSLPGRLGRVDAYLGLDGQLSRPAVSFDLSQVDGGKRLLTARGFVPLDIAATDLACGEPVDLHLVLPPIDQPAAQAVLPAVPDGEARLSASLKATGDACDPDLELVAAADAPAGQSGEVVRADLALSRVGSELSLEAFVEEGFRRRLLVSGTAQTDLSGTIAALRTGGELVLTEPERWADQLMVSVVPLDFSLQDLATFVEMPGGLRGRLAGGFQLTGSPTAPAISGAAQLIEGQIGGVDVSSGLLMLLPGDGGYDVSLDLALLERTSADQAPAPAWAPLRIAGFVPVPLTSDSEASFMAAPGLDLAVSGSLPLALLEGLVEGVSDAAGALGLDGRISGSLAAPVVQADAATAGSSLTYAPLGLIYEDIGLALRLAGQRLFIDTLHVANRKRFAVLGGRNRAGRRVHELSANGEATLDGLVPVTVDASVVLDGFWLIADRDHELALDGDLSLSGLWPSPRLEGSLALDSSQLFFGEEVFVGDRSLEVDPAVVIHRSNRETITRTDSVQEPALWQLFDIDVAVDLLRNLRLRATVPLQSDLGQQFAQLSSVSLDADLGGEVRVRQSDTQLSIQGAIETLRGTATVLGVPFDVRGGTISFLGDGYDNPLVDIDAVRRTGSYGDVKVHVSGFVDNLEIDPSSDEYPDKTDVVTLLLFGKPASEMADSEGEAGNQVIAATLSALTGSFEQAVGGSVFDELEIDPAGAVRVGWALSDRLFLRLEQRFEDNDTGNRTEVTLEYLISRRLYAEFKTGDRAASSANLYWRWRF